MRLSTLTVLAAACAAPATLLAVPIIDGTRDAQYGAAKAVQLTGTSFGNNTNPTVNVNNGSELDAAYGVVDGGNLYLMLTGNLETNFNKLEIFIDSRAGGQNRLRGDNPDVDFNGLNRMGENPAGAGNGLTFDAGFESDFFLTTSGGNTPNTEWFANFAETNTAGGGAGGFIGGSGAGNLILNGNNGVVIGYNLSNVLGVNSRGNPNDSDPASVLTGIEVLVPLSLIGGPTSDIKIVAFVNGAAHDFISNQILGPAPAGSDHLADPRNVNLASLAGDQFFTVAIPEPASCAGIALVGTMALRRRALKR